MTFKAHVKDEETLQETMDRIGASVFAEALAPYSQDAFSGANFGSDELEVIPGTDEAAIKAVFLEIPTHAAFVQVGTAYFKEFGKSLIDTLKSELSSSAYTDMMAIIVRKPQK